MKAAAAVIVAVVLGWPLGAPAAFAEVVCPSAAEVSAIAGFSATEQAPTGPDICQYVSAGGNGILRITLSRATDATATDYLQRQLKQPGFIEVPNMGLRAAYSANTGGGESLVVRFAGNNVVGAYSQVPRVIGAPALYALAQRLDPSVSPSAAPVATAPALPQVNAPATSQSALSASPQTAAPEAASDSSSAIPLVEAAAPAESPAAAPAAPAAPADGRVRSDRGTIAATRGPAPISRSLPTPAEAFGMPQSLVAALVTLLAITLITFPAQMFNRTLEDNYPAITAGWRRRTQVVRRLVPGSRAAGGQPASSFAGFAVVLLAGGLLGSLLNPSFGWNQASAVGYLAALLAVAVGAGLSLLVGVVFRRRKRVGHDFRLTGLPGGLVIAAVCVVLSRVVDFQPGYLYGVVAGATFAVGLGPEEEGRLTAIATGASLIVGVLAWFAWVGVHDAALVPGASFGLALLDTLLATLFVGAVVGAAIGAVPVRFMPGHKIWSWSRGAWAGVTAVAVFGLVSIMLNPASGPTHPGGAPLATVLVLFAVFALASVAFRQYWARRTTVEATVED